MEVLSGPEDNIVDKLYTPGFKNCKTYRRQTAFFQPSVFKCWSGSLMDIVKNEVKLEILMGVSDSNSKILKAINNLGTKKEKNRLLSKEANSVFEKSLGMAASSDDSRNRIRLIRYLYAKELLEIKLCISCDENQENLSLAHNKIGYFLKDDGAYKSFIGSMNESDSAVMRNGEDLAVFDSLSEEENAKKLKDKLDKKWEETDQYSLVFTPTDEFIGRIKEISDIKDQKEALEVTRKILEEMGVIKGSDNTEERKLRDYQEEAIDLWFQNNNRGILEHATGSGKTFTALNIIKKFYFDWPIVVIGVPYQMLADQWVDESEKYFTDEKLNFSITECWSENRSWQAQAKKALADREIFKLDKKSHLTIFVVVNESLKTTFRKEIVEDELFDLKATLFIGDECHNYNASLSEEDFPDYAYRLGLSATPIVDKDNYRVGEKKMEEFFGGIIHEYTIKMALNAKPKPFLCKYYYHPILCEMTEDDFEEWYEDYKITGWQSDDDSLDVAKKAAYGRMTAILSSMDSKLDEFEKLLIKNKTEKENTIVFCGQGNKKGRDLERAIQALRKNNWDPSSIAAEIDGKKQEKKERKQIIENFVNKEIDTLAAIKVLDEGIDVPSIKTAYILASTNNRRQFVQRRGRVLRISEDKDFAVIYDFIVEPPSSAGQRSKKLVENEFKRMQELSADAINFNSVEKIIQKYQIRNNV